MKFNSLIPELTVSDIDRTRDFYVNILQFKVEYERVEDRFVFLSYPVLPCPAVGISDSLISVPYAAVLFSCSFVASSYSPAASNFS